MLVMQYTDPDCTRDEFWCHGNMYCLQEKHRHYSTPVKEICAEKLRSLEREVAEYKASLKNLTRLGVLDSGTKKSLEMKITVADRAYHWNVDQCEPTRRKKQQHWFSCVDKVIRKDPRVLQLKHDYKYSVPKFNITSFEGIYPVADILMFQEAINKEHGYRLLHNYIFESIFEIEPVLSHGHIPTALDDQFAKAGTISTLKAREMVVNWMVDVVMAQGFNAGTAAGLPQDRAGGAAGSATGATTGTAAGGAQKSSTNPFALISNTKSSTSDASQHSKNPVVNMTEIHTTIQEWKWLLKRGAQNLHWVGQEQCVYYVNLDRSKRRRRRMRLLLGDKGKRVRALDHYDSTRWELLLWRSQLLHSQLLHDLSCKNDITFHNFKPSAHDKFSTRKIALESAPDL